MHCSDLGFLRSSLHTYYRHRICPPVLNFTEFVLGCNANVDPTWAQDTYAQKTGLNPEVVATLWKSYTIDCPFADPYAQETLDELSEVQDILEDNQCSLLNILKNGIRADFMDDPPPNVPPSPVESPCEQVRIAPFESDVGIS